MKVSVFVLLASCLAAPASGSILRYLASVFGMEQYEPGTWPPSFCNGISCPKFSVVETHDNCFDTLLTYAERRRGVWQGHPGAYSITYEVREYDASGWVSTAMTGISYDQAQYDMFMKLFNYISGKNEQEAKINMTCPVINRIIPGAGPACENNFTMSFFMPSSQAQTPAPTDETVFLSDKPQMTVYVSSFAGFASQEDYVEAADALARALPEGTPYHTQFWYAVGYDSPFRLLNRHNEVWFIGA